MCFWSYLGVGKGAKKVVQLGLCIVDWVGEDSIAVKCLVSVVLTIFFFFKRWNDRAIFFFSFQFKLYKVF